MGHGRNLRRDYRAEEGAPEIGLAQTIGKVREVRDKGIVLVDVPQTSMQPEREPPGEGELTSSLAYLPPRFRGVLFIRRGKSSLLVIHPNCLTCCAFVRLFRVGSFVVLSPNQSSGGEKMTWSIETLLRLSDIKELRVTGQWLVKP